MIGQSLAHLQPYLNLRLIPVPLKPSSKEPLVKWGNGWFPTLDELRVWTSRTDINWGVRCGEQLAVIDCDSEDKYLDSMATHRVPPDCPIVKTGRGHHIWMKSRRPIRSQRVNGVEIKCLGSYVMAPPSIHPSGSPYLFEVAPNGCLPEVDVEALLGLPIQETSSGIGTSGDGDTAPSDFALRYGKSPYPQSLCGRATKILTRSDGQVKHLLSLRCWKWHCRKCAPLLQRYWLHKLGSISLRFILRLPTQAKPTAFLRRIGKPAYIHIVANSEGWLFIVGATSDAEIVWNKFRRRPPGSIFTFSPQSSSTIGLFRVRHHRRPKMRFLLISTCIYITLCVTENRLINDGKVCHENIS